jgi:hypothetical protein
MINTPELFPFVLLRVAGGSLVNFQATETPATIAATVEIMHVRRKSVEQAKAISEELYDLVPTMSDASVRQLWITVRRNIHNQKILPSIPGRAFAVLPTALQRKVRSYNRLHAKLQLLEKQAEEQYESEIKSAKHAFASLLRETPHFQNGLLLSSATIGASLEKYLSSDPAQKTAITKKERSFMEYLSRMYTKPTPFSSFTHLAIATFAAADKSKDLVGFKSLDTTSHTHLNHDLYRYLYGLLMGRQEVKQLLPIALNPTIKRTDDSYNFLTNHNNQEAFQHIGITSSLDIFYTLVATAPHSLRYQELINLIVTKKYVNASTKDIAQYIDQLIDLGFFELDLGVSGIDREWDKKLLQQLSPLAANWSQLAEVARGLAKLRKLADEYETAPTTKRRQLLNDAFEMTSLTYQLLGAVPKSQEKQAKAHHKEGEVFRRTYSTDFTFEPHQLWYEDTILADQPTVSRNIKNSLESLGDLLARTRGFDRCHEEQEKMAEFFKATYGLSAIVSVLQFYKDYSRKKDELKTAPATTRRNSKNKKMLDVFMKNLSQQTISDEITFGRSAVAHLSSIPNPASFAAFFHAYQAGRDTRLVLNSTAEGSGKMFSRFLHLFNDSVTQQLRQTRNLSNNDILFAEVTDASFFNANLHPRLMPCEIITPGGHSALPSPAQLRVDDLTVSHHKSRSRLMLRHTPSGKEVMVFDLGFQNKRGRSKLYNLLCAFSFGPHHNTHALLGRINDRFKASSSTMDSVAILPRVIYENQIVLQRKEWHVPKSKLPARETSKAEGAYFLRLQQWRHALHIPDEVFIRGAHYKPQYISFKNPFLLSIFESSIRSCQDSLRIEEMLPHGEQLASTGGRAVEFLAQWDI